MVSKVKTDELEATQAGASIQINSSLKFSDGTILDSATPAGVDADLLDGQHGSYYYSPSNLPAAPPTGMTLQASGTITLSYYGYHTLSGTDKLGILMVRNVYSSKWARVYGVNTDSFVSTNADWRITFSHSTANCTTRNYTPKHGTKLEWKFYA